MGETYVVQPGDTLQGIAQQVYGDSGAWQRLYEANQEVIGADPDVLHSGARLILPPLAETVSPTTPPPPRTALGQSPSPAPAAATTAAATLQARPTWQPSPTAQGVSGTPTPVTQRLTGTRSVPPSPRYEPLPLQVDDGLADAIRELLGDDLAHYSLVVKHLSDGTGVSFQAERPLYAASLFKVPVMYEVFKQRELGFLNFDETLTITPAYLEFQLGELRWPLWSEVTIAHLLEAMITESDNIAAMLLHDRVGGWNIVQDMRAIGLKQTDISNTLPTTAADMALLLEMIARGQAVTPQASQEMIALLSRQRVNDRLPALLPAGTRVAHKTGNWDNVTHDVGVVYAPNGPYVIAVLSDRAWQSEPIARLSRLVYEHFEGGS